MLALKPDHGNYAGCYDLLQKLYTEPVTSAGSGLFQSLPKSKWEAVRVHPKWKESEIRAVRERLWEAIRIQLFFDLWKHQGV